MPANIRVEVAYALPEKQYLQRVTLDEGATVEQAIIASGLLALRDDIDLAKNKLGIYSRPVKLHDEVHDGDRVEIYRPLIADPKELRRQRAEKSAAKKPAADRLSAIKKALTERFLLFRALLTGQRRLVINVSQHTAAVEGQGQGLLSHFLVARLLTEDIEPGIGAERIRHHWRPQSISYLLLRHTDTNFCYIVWCQIVTLVDVRTVNHSFQSGTACGQHKKNRCGSSQRFTAHSDLIPFWARAVRGSSVICR